MLRVEPEIIKALDATIGAWKRQERYSGSLIEGAGVGMWPICLQRRRPCDTCPLDGPAGACPQDDEDAPMNRYAREGGKVLARESWQWFLAIRRQCTVRRPICEEIEILLFGKVSS